MKTENNLLFVLLLIVSLSIILSCSNSTGPGDTHEFPDAIDSVATGIALYVYSNGWGIILDTLEMDTEDTITIDIYEEPSIISMPKPMVSILNFIDVQKVIR